MYNVHIVVHGNLALRFKPVVWKSIILNCHLLNCGTENRKSPTVLRDVHCTLDTVQDFFALVWHQTTHASMENKHFITK